MWRVDHCCAHRVGRFVFPASYPGSTFRSATFFPLYCVLASSIFPDDTTASHSSEELGFKYDVIHLIKSSFSGIRIIIFWQCRRWRMQEIRAGKAVLDQELTSISGSP